MKYALFSTYLNDVMRARGITPEMLAKNLGFLRPTYVNRWVRGDSLPHLEQLPRLAEILTIVPVDLLIGWMIERCPELEEVLRKEVLEQRATAFPMSDSYARQNYPTLWRSRRRGKRNLTSERDTFS